MAIEIGIIRENATVPAATSTSMISSVA